MQKITFKVLPLVAAIAALTLTGGCATYEANRDYNQSEKGAYDALSQGRNIKSTVGQGDANASPLANFGHVSRNWVNPIPIKLDPDVVARQNLPGYFQNQVSLVMPGKVSLPEVLSEIQRSNKIRFDLNQDIYNTNNQLGTLVSGTSTTTPSTTAVTPVFVNDFVFKGSLSDALDLLAAKANVSWRWNGQGVDVFRYETRTYNIAALAGSTSSNSQVTLASNSSNQGSTQSQTATSTSTSGSSSASGGSNNVSNQSANTNTSNQGVTRTADLKTWDDVKSYLLSMLTTNGTMSVMESNGQVTIKDTPAVQKQVSAAIKSLNGLMGKQIYLNVDVYAITRDMNDDYGIDWNGAYAAAGLGLSYAATSGATGQLLTSSITSGPFSGSKAMLTALSKLGKTSIVNQFSLTTLNNQPTPIGNNTAQAYVQSISVTDDQNGNPQTSITAGDVYEGISMSITPKVQPTGKILLEYAMNLSSIDNIVPFTSGGNTVQLPTTTLKNILQRASLRSGQTLILSGFKQVTAQTTNSGVGSVYNLLTGGRSNADKNVQYLVITVTPYVADDNDE
jgi:type IVB pilus formation R64 PilN family outer membrane protein